MALATVTYTFVTGTDAVADEVNENFSDLVEFLNDHVLHKDGSKALDGNLDLGSFKIVNLDTPTQSTDAANKAYADTIIPVGMIAPYAAGGNAAAGTPPAGWLLCNGQAINRTTYSALFALIGTTYGVGNGTSTFNLPDFRGKMPFGSDGTRALGATGGSNNAVVVSHAHALPNHVHTIAHTHDIDPPSTSIAQTDIIRATGGGNAQMVAGTGTYGPFNEGSVTVNIASFTSGASNSANSGNPTTNPDTETVGVSATNANIPAYQAVNFMIRTGVV